MKNNPNHIVKSDRSYYERYRIWPSLFNLSRGAKILDVGCGTGSLGTYLQREYGSEVTGVDIIEDNVEIASRVLHDAFFGDIETMDTSVFKSKFEYIIFSDSLEHMLEPKAALKRVRNLMTRNGILLISMPNVRNFRVTLPLILSDQWEYQDEGLLDRTHLRFFTCTSICRLIEQCGYKIEQVLLDLPLFTKVGALNMLTLGVFRRHLTSHYFIKACLKRY